VLFGKYFGRRHDCGLIPGFNGLQRGQCRDDRFAATDIALKQPLHRVGPGQIRADFSEHAHLCFG